MPIAGVHVVRKHRADGGERYYYYAFRGASGSFWHTDGFRYDLRVHKLPQEFVERYEKAIAATRQRAPDGTLGALIVDYLSNPASPFKKLAPATQRDRRRHLDLIRDMRLKDSRKAVHAPLAAFEDRRMRKYIGAWRAEMQATPKKADEARMALSALLQWGVAQGDLAFNVCHGMSNLYVRKEEARIWTEADLAAFLSDASTVLRLAALFIRWTGLRRKDAVEIPASARIGDHLVWPSSKSRRTHELVIPILPPLRAVMQELDDRRAGFDKQPVTTLFNSRGEPWTPDGLSASFNKQRAVHQIAPSLHGLRKTAATDWIIHQNRHPGMITDDMICDQFDWTRATLKRMKRIYVDRSAVVADITGRRA